MFDGLKNPQYIVYLVVKSGDTWEFYGKTRVKAIDTEFNYRKTSYNIKISEPCYINGIKRFFFITSTNTQIGFKDSAVMNLSPSILHKLRAEHAIKELTSGIKDRVITWMLSSIIVGAFIGLVIGYIIGNFAPMGV